MEKKEEVQTQAAVPPAPEPEKLKEEATKESTAKVEAPKEEDKKKVEEAVPKDKKDLIANLESMMRDPRSKEQVKKLQEMAPLYQKHSFWDTQPVIHLAKEVAQPKEGPIEKKDVKEVRAAPLPLPDGFEWASVDLANDKEMEEVFELLRDNYVEDTDNMFRFKYSIPFLRWALTPPGYHKDWIVGVRVSKNKKLVGFITGIPTNVIVSGQKMPMAEINFLCVHKKLRTKRLAPVLIKEVTRRVNIKNVWQAVYTAGKYIPTPFAEALYYHRSLNVKKLVDIGFCGIPPKSTLKRQERINKLPDTPEIPGFRRMVKKDTKQVHDILNAYLKYYIQGKFKLYPELSLGEVKHFLLTKEDVIDTYVVEEVNEAKEKVITDFVSFYTLPSSVLKHESIKEMKAAYLYYYTANKHPLEKLVKAALIIAKKSNHDVFNCLNIMDNKKFLEELKFGPGNGNLMFYLFNFVAPNMNPEDLGMVLV